MDLSLPDSVAAETMVKIRELKAKSDGATIVVISADGSDETRSLAKFCGADLFFEKSHGSAFFNELAQAFSAGRDEPCASVELVKQIESLVAKMTGVELAERFA